MIYGRRKGARSWKEHFDSILRSEEARQRGFTVESRQMCPTHYNAREADGLIELFTWMTDTAAAGRHSLQSCWHFSLRRLR